MATSSVQLETTASRYFRRRSSWSASIVYRSLTSARRARSTRQSRNSATSTSLPAAARMALRKGSSGPLSRRSYAPAAYQSSSRRSAETPSRSAQRLRRAHAPSSGQRTSVPQRSKATARTATPGSCLHVRSGRFGFARVQAQLEQHAEALTHVRGLASRLRYAMEDLDRVLGVAPAVAALVALRFAERPEPLHASQARSRSGRRRVGSGRAEPPASPRVRRHRRPRR